MKRKVSVEPLQAEVWAILAYCVRGKKKEPEFCEQELDYDVCMMNTCSNLRIEFCDDAVVLTPDNA